MNPLRNDTGVTLVESIVTLILSLIIAFVIYTVAFVYTNESSTSLSRFMMQQQYDNVASQIAAAVRRASFAGAEGETPAAHGAGFDSVTSIRLFDLSGQVFAQYSLRNGFLYEGLQQKQYSAGGSVVNIAGDNSFFIVSPQRKSITLHLSICKTERNKVYTLSLRKAVFVCRN
ncbi:MAG: hypothetical protein JXA71_04265 [Chitinispirillaceae bacterium]|nr:hypothetical protein [Chitinispirillaceae bacterium]